MRILNVNDVCCYIAPKYNTYRKGLVESYIGDSTDHLFLNFALEDKIVRQILNEYNSSNSSREKLNQAYKDRVDSLVTEELYLRDAESHEKIPSLEVTDRKSRGYLVCMSGSKNERFSVDGSRIYVPSEFYDSIKNIRRAEIGTFSHKKIAGFFYLSEEIKGFNYYVTTRKADNNGEYYLEKYTVDYDTRKNKISTSFLSRDDYEEFIKEKKLKEI